MHGRKIAAGVVNTATGALALAAVLILAACADPNRQALAPQPVQVDFSEDTARSELHAGRSAFAAGNETAAATHFEAAVKAWPPNKPAWKELAETYQKSGSQTDMQYALFFLDRVDWAERQHNFTSAMAFDLFVHGKAPRTEAAHNPRIMDMARRMAEFYRWRGHGR